jgi:DnaK suppressor protein
MTAHNLKTIRGDLLDEEHYLLRELATQQAEQDRSAHEAGEERGGDPEQLGSELFEQEKLISVERELEHTLREVQHALHKLDAGTYGVCDGCGRNIPAQRLRAHPQAALCVACKTREEHVHPPAYAAR